MILSEDTPTQKLQEKGMQDYIDDMLEEASLERMLDLDECDELDEVHF